MKSQLFKIAHAIKGEFSTWSDALRHAWKVIKLKAKLKKGEVSFSFKKIDGSIRQALGTLNIIVEKSADWKPRKEVIDQISYFDMGVGQWRSFKAENLI